MLLIGCPFLLVASLASAQGSGTQNSKSPIPDLFASLSYIELSYELTAARYVSSHSDPEIDDTHFWTLKFPWENELDVGVRTGRLYLEAAVGILSASDGVQVDTVLGKATADTQWMSYGSLVGAGWTQNLGEHCKLLPSLGFAQSRLENDTDYNAAGQVFLAPVLENGLANFDATATATVASITLLYERTFASVKTHWRGRWSQILTDVFQSSTSQQEGVDMSSVLALRVDMDGPTSVHLGTLPIEWGAFLGYIGLHQVDESAVGFSEVYEFGLSGKVPVTKLLSAISLSGSLLYGDNVQGFSLGCRFLCSRALKEHRKSKPLTLQPG
jgi:hypothetical protein